MTNQTRAYFPFTLPNATSVSGQKPASRVLSTIPENEVWNVRGYTRDPGLSCEVTWIFDNDQFSTFYNWYHNDERIRRGLKWFWVRLPTSDGLASWQLARFMRPYEAQVSGTFSATVRAQLEMRDRFVIKSRPYTVPAPLNYGGTPGAGDPLWDEVRFAVDFGETWGFKDVKNDTEPTVVNDVTLESGTNPADYAYVKGNEAFLDYGISEAYSFYNMPAWTIECRFANLGGEKDSVILAINDIFNEPFDDTYASSFGIAVRRGTFYFFCIHTADGTCVELAVLHSVVLPQTGWYHAVVQERNGMLEVGVTPLDSEVGQLITIAPQLFTLSAGARLVVGCDETQGDYHLKKYFTGWLDDLRITTAIRYP